MLRDEIIANLNMLVEGLKDLDVELAELEDGLEIETPNFVLNVSIDLGVCIECMEYPPMYDADICGVCDVDRRWPAVEEE